VSRRLGDRLKESYVLQLVIDPLEISCWKISPASISRWPSLPFFLELGPAFTTKKSLDNPLVDPFFPFQPQTVGRKVDNINHIVFISLFFLSHYGKLISSTFH